MKLVRVKDYNELSEKACEIFVHKLKTLKNPVFGLATGSTPEGLYERLIEKYNQKEITFQHATTFNLDEYIGLSEDNPESYHFFMMEKLFKHIDLPLERAYVPDGMA